MKKKIDSFFDNYVNFLSSSLLQIDKKSLDNAANAIYKKIKNQSTIFVCGNGGSAAISNHYICDFLKFFREKTKLKPKMISLSDNIETIMAISNDIDYKIFVDTNNNLNIREINIITQNKNHKFDLKLNKDNNQMYYSMILNILLKAIKIKKKIRLPSINNINKITKVIENIHARK